MTTDQEAEDVAASVLHLMTQRGKDARSWQAQAEQHEATIDRLRARLASSYAQVDRYHVRARMMLQQSKRLRAELTAARGLLQEIADSEALCNCGPYFSQGEALEKRIRGLLDTPRVSSNGAEQARSPDEETRAPACPRCGSPLNNLSPGISVVAGGISICTTCLNLGETEIARAKGM